MATTFVPVYDQPIVGDTEELREILQDWLKEAMGDMDKTDEITAHEFYAGQAEVAEWSLKYLVGKIARCPSCHVLTEHSPDDEECKRIRALRAEDADLLDDLTIEGAAL